MNDETCCVPDCPHSRLGNWHGRMCWKCQAEGWTVFRCVRCMQMTPVKGTVNHLCPECERAEKFQDTMRSSGERNREISKRLAD